MESITVASVSAPPFLMCPFVILSKFPCVILSGVEKPAFPLAPANRKFLHLIPIFANPVLSCAQSQLGKFYWPVRDANAHIVPSGRVFVLHLAACAGLDVAPHARSVCAGGTLIFLDSGRRTPQSIFRRPQSSQGWQIRIPHKLRFLPRPGSPWRRPRPRPHSRSQASRRLRR